MRITIITGIFLLIATLFGVKWVMDSSANAGRPVKTNLDSKALPEYVVCWGHFDVELGVLGLYPKQPGDVVRLAGENSRAKKGDVLLQIDDAIGLLKVREAGADVKAGEQQLDVSKLLIEQARFQREQQEAAIRAVDGEIKKAGLERDRHLKSFEPGQAIRKTIEELYAAGLSQLLEKKKAEQAKLEEVKLMEPKAHLVVAQAEADLDAKRTRLKQASEMLKHFQIVALTDGTVLRTYVRTGETLGPTPRLPAIDFLPEGPMIVRAEVMQEWGRLVSSGQIVEIEDDTHNGPKWEGKVKTLSKWYAITRSPVLEPFRLNDVRTLECIIEVTGGDTKSFIGQRVRAKIKI